MSVNGETLLTLEMVNYWLYAVGDDNHILSDILNFLRNEVLFIFINNLKR